MALATPVPPLGTLDLEVVARIAGHASMRTPRLCNTLTGDAAQRPPWVAA